MSDEGRARVGRAEWAKRVERWKDSGLSAAEFGAEIGVNPRTLTYWKWLLGKDSTLEQRARRRPAAPTSETMSGFVEVHAPGGSAVFELALSNGRRLQIPTAFDADALARLLAVLERP